MDQPRLRYVIGAVGGVAILTSGIAIAVLEPQPALVFCLSWVVAGLVLAVSLYATVRTTRAVAAAAERGSARQRSDEGVATAVADDRRAMLARTGELAEVVGMLSLSVRTMRREIDDLTRRIEGLDGRHASSRGPGTDGDAH